VEGSRFALVDAGSRNGVYLRITRPEPVFPGDLFLVGHQLLRLDNVDESGEQPPGADGTRLFGTPLDPPWGRLTMMGRGDMVGDAYYLRAPSVVIGRESGDLLFPADRFLSRQHAKLQLQMEGGNMSVFLEDLGSANGSYLRLRGRATVGPNDTFRVGDQILRIKVG
jgi:pSer/pThr/pTyr-binding forkhead associated (FHA) protein